MTKLTFDIDTLKSIAEHARACKEHSATYDMMLDPKCWKEGTTPDASGWPKPEQIDSAKVKPHLQLVKDHGVYLLSSGIPRLMDPRDPTGQSSLVAYAKGFGIDAGYDAWSRVSGDDFVEAIDLAFVEKAIASGAKALNVHLTADKLSLDFERTRESSRPPYSGAVLSDIHKLSGSTARPKWADHGKSYVGAVYGYDTHVVLQKVGRGLVVHEKALLEQTPQKGKWLRIDYPENANEKATVAEVTRSRSCKPVQGLAR
jgi:hypothetical protein